MEELFLLLTRAEHAHNALLRLQQREERGMAVAPGAVCAAEDATLDAIAKLSDAFVARVLPPR